MVIAFDFDGTLTNKDTLFGFFLHANTSFRFLKIILYVIAMILTKCKIISNHQLKTTGILLFLKGKSKTEIEMIAINYVKTIKLNEIYYKYYICSNNTWVISASFYEYLQFIFPEQTIIASQLKYNDNEIVEGLAFNCFKYLKVTALKKRNIDRIDIFYTDNINSDKAVADFACKTVVVKNGLIIKNR
jgi:phosphoserine phosphatase